MIEELRKVIKRLHYPLEVMLVCVRWYSAYPLSFRHREEMMAERGVVVDHVTVHRWAVKILPVLAAVFRRRDSQTIDFLLRAKTDCAAARCFLERAIGLHSTTSSSRISGRSNGSCGQCSDSNAFAAHASLLPALRLCT
jgi:transposase-like protein